MRSIHTLMLLAVLGGSCRAPIPGFPHYPSAEIAEKVNSDLRAIECKIAGTNEEEELALRPFQAPVLSLAHQRIDCFGGYRFVSLRRQHAMPALLYPRLTWPHLAKLDPDDTYRVPLLLHRPSYCKNKDDGQILSTLCFELEQRGSCRDKKRVRVNASQPPQVEFYFGNCTPGQFPRLHRDTIPVLLTVPMCDVKPGKLYDLRILPRLRIDAPCACVVLGDLSRGGWSSAADSLDRRFKEASASELRATGLAAYRANHPLFRDLLTSIASALSSMQSRTGTDLKAAAHATARLMRELDSARICDAPVYFDCGSARSGFDFVVAGDLQLHSRAHSASRFFGLLDAAPNELLAGVERRIGKRAANRLRATMTDDEIADYLDGIGEGALERITKSKFAVLVGDCVDGAASQAAGSYAANYVTGLPGPASPFVNDGELDLFAHFLRTTEKPVFAIPGNHDAGVGYGGVLNWPLDALGWTFNWIWDDAASFMRTISDFAPGLVRPTLFGFNPYRYDGLEEWQYTCGPTNLFFVFRGFQFVCMNSMNQDHPHRATVGGVALNTGGGVQGADALWLDVVLNWFADSKCVPAEGVRPQLVFMHHDPRAAYPVDGRDREEGFGIYETIETPVAMSTFGYFGFSYATYNAVYIPLWSATAEYVYRLMFGVTGPLTREWMRRSFWSESSYGAKELIETINARLGHATEDSGGVRALFLAHNNTPMNSKWLRDGRSRLLFRDPKEPEWRESPVIDSLMCALHWFVTRDESKPPPWARAITVPPERNADVVRLDDVSDTFHDDNHGFMIVECVSEGRLRSLHVPLPTAH